MRWPSRSSWKSFSMEGTEGYGFAPIVMISHRSTPNDHTSDCDVYRRWKSVSGAIHFTGSLG